MSHTRKTLSIPNMEISYLEWNHKDNLKNLTWKKIPGTHWPFLSNPEEFNLTIAEFLAQSI